MQSRRRCPRRRRRRRSALATGPGHGRRGRTVCGSKP